MYNTPILFLIFNRPDTAIKVFERIRQIKPSKLYVAADAARVGRPDEAQRCAQTRAIIDRIDWDCELKTLYRTENLGCKMAVSSAITWFFEQEEMGIILEDDCLPDLSFFPYCEELLNKYKDDDRIGHIGANCFLPGIIEDGLSYDFCTMPHIWGWATWRRVWKNYDVNFPYWTENCRNKEKINNLFNTRREKIYFTSFLSDTLKGNNGICTWDTQYLYTLRVQNQLSIYPAINLVKNIGIGDPNAVHTAKKRTITKYVVPASAIQLPLSHPPYIMRNKKLDNVTFKKIFFSYMRLLRYFLK
jgi:hypothetical protein